jgi:hypothetical protein
MISSREPWQVREVHALAERELPAIQREVPSSSDPFCTRRGTLLPSGSREGNFTWPQAQAQAPVRWKEETRTEDHSG